MRADVLVVCTANAIRSPFVARFLSAQLAGTAGAGLRVASAGTAARPGQQVESGAREIAEGRGISLDTHRTRRLEEAMLHGGLTVLCAERAHRRIVLDMRPDLIASVFTIREFARLATAARASGAVGETWPQIVAEAARARFGDRHVADADDDLVDPIGQPSDVWGVFERDAVDAVTAIVAAVRAADRTSADVRGLVEASTTRRAYRSALRDLIRTEPL